jgi:hypothetical protein
MPGSGPLREDGAPYGVGVSRDGAVWVPAPGPDGFFNARFYVLDPETERLRSFAVDAGRPQRMDRVPGEALLPLIRNAGQVPGRMALTYQEAVYRFSRWFLPRAPLSRELSFPGWITPNRVREPGSGVEWAIEQGRVLARTSAGKTERFPFSGGPIPTMPATQLLAVAPGSTPTGGDTVFIVEGSTKVRRWHDGIWQGDIPIPPRAFGGVTLTSGTARWSPRPVMASRTYIGSGVRASNATTIRKNSSPGSTRSRRGRGAGSSGSKGDSCGSPMPLMGAAAFSGFLFAPA